MEEANSRQRHFVGDLQSKAERVSITDAAWKLVNRLAQEADSEMALRSRAD